MSNWKIPLFVPDFSPDDEKAVLSPLQRSWLTMGEITSEFERVFAQKIQVEHAYAVGSGTAALHLALMALNLEPGDEVLLPSLTFVACANVIRAVGANPVFVDITSEDDWTLSAEDLRRKVTKRSRAILVVHYAGFPAHIERIIEIAREHEMLVIEDCAHALVSRRRKTFCGGFGDFGCFSFFSNKNMTTGEGGMIVTNSAENAERIRLLRSHGMTTLTMDRYKGRAHSYDVTQVGLNYRIDEIRSSLGLSQLKRLDEYLRKRKSVYQTYVHYLNDISEISLPFQDCEDEVGYHIFPVLIQSEQERGSLIQSLKEDGVQTSIHYPPIHSFSAYRCDAACPLTDNVAARELTLPFYPGMIEEDVAYITHTLKRGLATCRVFE